MDAVYFVKPGADDSSELRYSLRSLSNVKHDRVHLIGQSPEWVRNVTVHDLPILESKYRTTEASVRYACLNPDISDPFQLWMDDTYCVRKVRSIGTFNRGPIRDVIRHYKTTRRHWSTYLQGMEQTLDLLEHHGYHNPLSFELHIPIVIHKQPMLEALDMGKQLRAPHKRSIYGAIAGLKGKTIPDVKVYTMDQDLPQGPWISSQDDVWRYGVGHLVRWLFPNPGAYEAT